MDVDTTTYAQRLSMPPVKLQIDKIHHLSEFNKSLAGKEGVTNWSVVF